MSLVQGPSKPFKSCGGGGDLPIGHAFIYTNARSVHVKITKRAIGTYQKGYRYLYLKGTFKKGGLYQKETWGSY